MAIPAGPANGQTFVENATGRRFVYDGLSAAWLPFDRVAITDFDDVDGTVVGTANQPLVYNGTTNLWQPNAQPAAGAFVPRIESTVSPTNADAYEVGTVWYNSTTGQGWIARTFAPTTGIRYFDEQTPANPGGPNLMNGGGDPWGQNFLVPFDVTINTFGFHFDSVAETGTSNVTIDIYNAPNGPVGTGDLVGTGTALAVAAPTNTWVNVTLDAEIDLVGGTTYSAVITSPSWTDRPSHNANALGTPFVVNPVNNIVATALIPNGWDLVYRYGFNEGTVGTIWWPIVTPTGVGRATIWRNATPPVTPEDGRLWYNTTLSALFVYDLENTNWIQVLQ